MAEKGGVLLNAPIFHRMYRNPTARLTVLYVIIGGIYIYLSDRLLPHFITDPEVLTRYQTYKGWAFILVTATVLFWLLRRYRRQLVDQEQTLGESKQQFQAIAEQIPDIIYHFQLRPERQITYISPVVEALTGFPRKRFYTDPAFIFNQVHLDDRSILKKNLADPELIRERQQLRWYTKDGKIVWLEHSAVPIYNPEGQFIAVQGVARDITEQKELEEQLIQSQKMEALGQIAGGIAHDFNNVLAAISGAAQMLELQPQDDEHIARYVNIIQSSVERGTTVTDRMLILTRSRECHPLPIQAEEFLKEFSEIARHTLPKYITMHVQDADTHAVIQGDPGQLQQVFFTLAINAADAMPEGGTITLGIRQPTPQERRIYGNEGDKEFWCLTVADEGVGIEPALHEKIFEPFYTTKESSQGTGLGLPIVYRILQMHDGWIAVDSEKGQGATFILGLPASTTTPADLIKSADFPRGQEETILLVEDEILVQNLITEALRNHGYQVQAVGSGAEAQTVLAEHHTDINLVITDIGLPDMNGHQLILHIAAEYPDIPIIAMTGYVAVELDESVYESGAEALFRKPIDLQELGQKIRDLIV